MKQKRAKRKADDVRKAEYAEMAEKSPDRRALDIFKRKPYQAAVMMREQGRQMTEKYNIEKGVDAGGKD